MSKPKAKAVRVWCTPAADGHATNLSVRKTDDSQRPYVIVPLAQWRARGRIDWSKVWAEHRAKWSWAPLNYERLRLQRIVAAQLRAG
jgi:hypothetical protein